MELSGMPSVSMLIRILVGDLYKTRILGFDRLPSESTFSRFKESVDIDRAMRILAGMI
jgi:IS5 family transposase